MPCKGGLRRFEWGPEVPAVLTSYVLCDVSEQEFWNIVLKECITHLLFYLRSIYLKTKQFIDIYLPLLGLTRLHSVAGFFFLLLQTSALHLLLEHSLFHLASNFQAMISFHFSGLWFTQSFHFLIQFPSGMFSLKD